MSVNKFGLIVTFDSEEAVKLEIEVGDGGEKVMANLPAAIRKLADNLAGMIEKSGNLFEDETE